MVVYVHCATGPDAEARFEAERVRWGYDTMDGRGVIGDAAAVADGVNGWVEAGATSVILQPTPDDLDPAAFVRFAADEVRPLLA